MKRTLRRCLTGGLSCLVLSGCYTLQFYHDTRALPAESNGNVTHASTVFAAMEIGDAARLHPVCPSGVSKIEMKQTAVDGVLHYVSLGFYSPQTIEVWCTPGGN